MPERLVNILFETVWALNEIA